MLMRMRDYDLGRLGIAQCKLPALPVPFQERPNGLTSSANGEEITYEKMVEVGMHVRYLHHDLRSLKQARPDSCIGTPRCVRLSVR